MVWPVNFHQERRNRTLETPVQNDFLGHFQALVAHAVWDPLSVEQMFNLLAAADGLNCSQSGADERKVIPCPSAAGPQ